MTRLTDDELGRQLERRLSAARLDDAARHELLGTISDLARAQPRRRLAAGRSGWRWLGGAAAAAVALVLVAVVALPGAQVVPRPSGTAAPSPTAPWSVWVLLGSDLAALAHDPAQHGRVVIAQAEFAEAVCYGDCPPQVVLAADSRVKVVGVSDASAIDVGAFRIEDREVAFLGAVERSPNGVRWTLADIGALNLTADTRQDFLYAVEGWLVETGRVYCPAIPAVHDDDPWNDRWYCQPSWLAPEPAYTEKRYGNAVVGLPLPEGSLVVQRGGYDEFAVDPQSGDRGPEPRLGVYLIRPDGCPPTVSDGDCPVWETVARLDPTIGEIQLLTPSPSPSPDPPASPSETAATQDAILGAVARWLADEYAQTMRPPAGWSAYVYTVVTDEQGSEHDGEWGRDPELAVAGPPLFGGAMTEATRQAVASALLPLSAEFVDDPQEVVDPEGFEHFGCRPYLGGKWMLRLGPPHLSADGERYFIYVNVDKGCAGDTYVVEVTPTDDGLEVTRVVVTGHWIV